MFKRRHKTSWFAGIREFLWPRTGWIRSTTYLFHRIGRMGPSPHSVAAGLACGIAISFTPFVGLHFVLAALLAWVIRANVIASAIGTATGNPWTFPIIWVWTYNVGTALGMNSAAESAEKLDFATLFANVLKSLLQFDFSYFAESAWPIYGPMLVGSIPTAIVVWIATYLVIRSMVASYHRARRARRRVGDARRAKSLEAQSGETRA